MAPSHAQSLALSLDSTPIEDDLEPTEPIVLLRCPGCFVMTAVSLTGPAVQRCDACQEALAVAPAELKRRP